MGDERQIRELVATWRAASQRGDVDTVLGLMTDDVVFLLPGRPPMRKGEFASMSRASAGKPALRIESTSDIEEIQVSGEWAFMWTKLSVVVTPTDGGQSMKRAGHTLTVLRRVNGKWLLARDANLLSAV
ncbi:MAG: SgcJ/EcaC family oxidoreductase [Gammaproteobacteria bacterium]